MESVLKKNIYTVKSFHFKCFWRTHPYVLILRPLSFKARVFSTLFACFAEANVLYIPQYTPSGAKPADLLITNTTAGHFPICISRGGTWLRFECAITLAENVRITIVSVDAAMIILNLTL